MDLHLAHPFRSYRCIFLPPLWIIYSRWNPITGVICLKYKFYNHISDSLILHWFGFHWNIEVCEYLTFQIYWGVRNWVVCLGKHLKTDGGGGEESHNRIKFGCINKLSTAFNKNNQISHHCNWGVGHSFFSYYKIHLFWSTMASFFRPMLKLYWFIHES